MGLIENQSGSRELLAFPNKGQALARERRGQSSTARRRVIRQCEEACSQARSVLPCLRLPAPFGQALPRNFRGRHRTHQHTNTGYLPYHHRTSVPATDTPPPTPNVRNKATCAWGNLAVFPYSSMVEEASEASVSPADSVNPSLLPEDEDSPPLPSLPLLGGCCGCCCCCCCRTGSIVKGVAVVVLGASTGGWTLAALGGTVLT